MRPSEIMPFATEDSRCGEIYVSNKADKWTFCCSYCQKGTSDIGIFICHIRLDHLSSLLDRETQKENVSPEEGNFSETHAQSIVVDNTFSRVSDNEIDINLIKAETLSQKSFELEPVPTMYSKTLDISSLTDKRGTENVFPAKNSISSGYPTIDINEEYYTITSKSPDLTAEDSHSVQENHEVVRVLYNKKGKNFNKINKETIANNDDEHIYNVDTSSVDDDDDDDILIEDDIDLENIDDNKASSSKRKKEDQKVVHHVCHLCNIKFKLRIELDNHLKNIHNQKLCEMPLKCKECRKEFRSVAGYKNHLNSHDERNQKQCPICKARHNQNYFITHVMGHENNTCFPCMVCGKIFSNHVERMKHWETHAKYKPFVCDLCYRRFRRKHFLLHHLKSHGQYNCYFCPEKFVTSKTPRHPYVCSKCEKLPDVEKQIEHRKLFANKSYIDESKEE